MNRDEGIYFDVSLIVPYHVDQLAGVTWMPWTDGPLLGFELRGRDQDPVTRIYIDPRSACVYRGVGMPEVDEVLYEPRA